jgi:hypothetical protein
LEKSRLRRFFQAISFVAAGKRLLLRILRSQHSHIPVQQRGFCRLLRAMPQSPKFHQLNSAHVRRRYISGCG